MLVGYPGRTSPHPLSTLELLYTTPILLAIGQCYVQMVHHLPDDLTIPSEILCEKW